MDYWESILNEVLHKDSDACQFKFTDVGLALLRHRKRQQRKSGQSATKAPPPMYFLGEDFAGVYFTQREAETLYFLLKGNTIPETGKCLNLSARTIEYYVKNMKLKVSVKSKDALLKKVRTTDFMTQLGLIEKRFKDDVQL